MTLVQDQPRSRVRSAALTAAGFVAVIWLIQFVHAAIGAVVVNTFGLRPNDVGSLPDIVTSPFVHADFAHLMANTVPGALFAFLVSLAGQRVFWVASLIVVALGGFGTWLFGGSGTIHVGASGLVYGWLAFLIVRGFLNRRLGQAALGIVLAVIYGSLIFGVLPGQAGVSWQGHLFGAVGGVVAGAALKDRTPRQPKLSKAARNAGF